MAVSALKIYSAGDVLAAFRSEAAVQTLSQRIHQFHIVLNELWRVRLNDPSQWILQRQHGRNADGSPRYRDRSFHALRRTLLREIRGFCGEVDPSALRQVEALPERFPYKKSTCRW